MNKAKQEMLKMIMDAYKHAHKLNDQDLKWELSREAEKCGVWNKFVDIAEEIEKGILK
jgi:hypothetical protein